MGGNSSTRRVSFESDENDNVMVVKGVRLSENVINRMREPTAPLKPKQEPAHPLSPLLQKPPPSDPKVSLPHSKVETVTHPPLASPPPPPPQPQPEQVPAPTVIDIVLPIPPPSAPASPPASAAFEPDNVSACASASASPNDPIAPTVPPTPPATLAPPVPDVSSSAPSMLPVTIEPILSPVPHPSPHPAEPATPPPRPASGDTLSQQHVEPPSIPPLLETIAPCEPVTPPSQPSVETVSPAPVPEPSPVPPAASAVDEEALRKKITDELQKGLEQERAKAERDLLSWLEAEKARSSAQVQAEAQSHVRSEVSRLLSAERDAAQQSVQQAILKEKIAAEDEQRRVNIYAKKLASKEADLNRQEAFYRDQVARLEEWSAEIYKITTDNYHKAADQVNAKYKRYEWHPVCADLQGQILACYKENAGKTLLCSNLAAKYLECVNSAKQTGKFAASWTEDITC
ncbi:coiled-coil-helix-coiled-coil-helix domain containing 3a isoform X1 [Synchiropus splendidus]|uniref:coiled-coil-helix-coiled-coil-helix domain containing 3a isoform X1 n=1 Tax=Synchiropus splendidus TaxID=270530 RepID=UPI00237E55DC|nr:coiled-coil-helix-coiled-coil-helix domain containing 3a isoform X1 [Synchiropus splendidus]